MLGQTHGFPRREFAYTRGLVVQGGTVALAGTQSFVNIAGTWNTSGVATALKVNVTNTASGASSLLCDFQATGVSQFKVDKSGIVTATGSGTFVGLTSNPAANSSALTATGSVSGSSSTVSLSVTSTWNTTGIPIGLKFSITDTASNANSSFIICNIVGGSPLTKFLVAKNGDVGIAGSYYLGTSTVSYLSCTDPSISGRLTISDGSGDFSLLQFGGTTSSYPAIGRNGVILEMLGADGAAKAAVAVYNTKTSATNFERLDIQWATNVCQVWTEKGSGGGTARDFVLGADATELHRFQTGNKQSFFAATPVVQQTSGANLTNNVTAGGTTDQIDNFTDLVIYANDAAAIRNDIYQLSRKLKQINDGLRSFGLFT